MYSKFITIVVIPQRTSIVRKFKISTKTIPFLLLGLAAFLFAWGWMIFDYFSIRAEQGMFMAKQKRYESREMIADQFSDEFEKVELHIANLETINNKLRAFTRLEPESRLKRQVDQEKVKEKLQIAKQEGILNAIASDNAEVDLEKIEKESRHSVLVSFLNKKENPIKKIPSGWPVKGFLSQEFGIVSDPFTGQTKPHHGIDIATKILTPVKSPADGFVIFVGKDDFFGNLVEIDHGNGFKTRYGHLARPEVEKGDLVKKNSLIAQVGNTGRATGPHLHYEVLLNGIPQNPAKYIQGESQEGL